MSFFTTDHNEAGNMFDPVAPGKYEAVITQAEVTAAKESGNPMIKVTYTIRSDVDQRFQKRKLFDNYVASEKAMFKFQQAAKAIGMPQGSQVGSIEEFAKMILFRAVKITVANKKEVYQGEERVRDNVTFVDEPSVPYNGGNGPAVNPFEVPPGVEDETPPWEQAEEKPKGKGKKGKQADPFADDGKPIDISDDDLPF
jgi:hypothetical protein